jgi:hypothetical protein
MSEKYYMGNPLLKRTNTPTEFSQEQLIELARCAADPVYFAKKYIKIVNIDDGLVQFDMWPFQEKMLRTFHENRFSICKLPRQCGKCFSLNTMVKVRNKITGEILEITVGELYEKIKKKDNTDMP